MKQVTGRVAYLESTKRFYSMIRGLDVRCTMVDGNHACALTRYYLQPSASPSPSVATFNDVPLTHPFNKFVEALYQSGITAGCGNNNFCPDAPVTRGQMAVFLSAALGLHWAP